MKLKTGTSFGSLRSGQYRDPRIQTSRDVKVKMAQFSRCIRGIKVGMNKFLFAVSAISLKSKRIWEPAVRRSELHTRQGLENAACSS